MVLLVFYMDQHDLLTYTRMEYGRARAHTLTQGVNESQLNTWLLVASALRTIHTGKMTEIEGSMK